MALDVLSALEPRTADGSTNLLALWGALNFEAAYTAARAGEEGRAWRHWDRADRYVAVAVLAVVASGWRPRLTALPHWWVSFSVPVSISIPDGGDHVTQVLTLLLLPVALTDRRRWHWAAPPDGAGRREMRLLAVAALVLIRVQVAGIYLHASVAKLGVTAWRDGTALYYWLADPMFGAPLWMRGPLISVLSHGTAVAALTWGSLALEFALVLGLVAPRRRWPLLLAGELALHLGIAVFMGLWSFGLATIAALVLYLRPVDLPFPMPQRVRAGALAVAGRIRRATPSRITAVLPGRVVTRRP